MYLWNIVLGFGQVFFILISRLFFSLLSALFALFIRAFIYTDHEYITSFDIMYSCLVNEFMRQVSDDEIRLVVGAKTVRV